MNSQPTLTFAPFRTCPGARLISPASAFQLNETLGLNLNLHSGTASQRRKAVLWAAAVKLVGVRKPNERASAWVRRANEALKKKFP